MMAQFVIPHKYEWNRLFVPRNFDHALQIYQRPIMAVCRWIKKGEITMVARVILMTEYWAYPAVIIAITGIAVAVYKLWPKGVDGSSDPAIKLSLVVLVGLAASVFLMAGLQRHQYIGF
jgi:hypothetical protein